MPKTRPILLVEDDATIALVIREALTQEGYVVHVATSLAARDAWLAQVRPMIVITDVMLPDGNALDTAAVLSATIPTIVLSAQNTLDTAVRASEKGAFDYLPKPFDLAELIDAVKSAEIQNAEPEPLALATDAHPAHVSPHAGDDALPLIGRAAAMQDVYRTIARLGTSDLSVLILGESGTGKELVAQAIHRTSRRRDGPFVAVNMAAIPAELIESELFGHEKGAFTGAHARYAGRFEQAMAGTLFLDEIGDMPLAAQTRLLRVLQTGMFSAVGSARNQQADVRIIAATNKDLHALVASGEFREDLFYRLNVIPINLPPLRARRDDIGLLAQYFLEKGQDGEALHTHNIIRKNLTESAVTALKAYHWPGNVRELENGIQRLMLMTREAQITARHVTNILSTSPHTLSNPNGKVAALADLDVTLGQPDIETWIENWLNDGGFDQLEQGDAYAQFVKHVEKPLLRVLLKRYRGNQIKTAAHLGINRNTLRKKIADHGLGDKI